MEPIGLKPVWKKRLTNLAVVAAFVLAFSQAPWMPEYFRHREAVLETRSTGAVDSNGARLGGNPETAVPAIVSEGAFPGTPSPRFGLLVPDAEAEKRETVLIGPNPEIKTRLVRLIRESERELFVNVYLLTEPDVTEEIVAAKKRGVDVKVILEKDPYKLPGANRKSRDRLLNAGVDVFSSKDAFAFVHAKYVVADGARYVFATGNFTKSTFQKNREYFVFGDDPVSAEFLHGVFSADFRGSPYVGKIPDRFYLAPVDARKKAVAFVKSAKESIFVLAPSVSDEEFVKALNDAAEAGVKVRVCLIKDASAEDFARFAEDVGATATSRAQLHAKTVLVDGVALFVGSANFTENSLDRNRETGAVLNAPETIRNYENTLSRDCKW